MPGFDITQTNAAVDRLLAETTDPRHRFLLQAYHRHRNLEMAGRYEVCLDRSISVACVRD